MALIWYRDVGEGTFRAVQDRIALDVDDLLFRFGPLSAKLSDLMNDGYALECGGKNRSRFSLATYRIYLSGRHGLFRVGSVSPKDLASATNLQKFVKRYVEGNRIADIPPIADPLDNLLHRYPRRAKAAPMIGNHTLIEHIRAIAHNPN